MDISDEKGKEKLIKQYTPPSRHLEYLLRSFIFGGIITGCGEGLRLLLLKLGIEEKLSFTLVSIFFIVLASILTAVGVFDSIARQAGAGTLVPITGFSNSITSEAIDARSEGYILGVGAKIFTLAGPVLLYGTVAGVIYGVLFYALKELTRLLG